MTGWYILKKLDFRRLCLIFVTQVDEFVLLQERLGDSVARDVVLAPYTTFNIGGPAKYFFEANSPRQLLAAFDIASTNDIKHFLLGGGSNILVSDEGFDGLVIRDDCRDWQVGGNTISAQSGVWFDKLVDIAAEHSLTGLEFAAGIPGNVGGAIYGNAGAFGNSVADILESAVLYSPEGGIKIVGPDYFGFAYRHSRLKELFEVVLSVRFRLKAGEKGRITDKINEHREIRRAKHPDYRREGCAGSVFKNIKEPELLPAGKLLEDAGAQGLKIGDAQVFEKHCNIIVNKGKAKASEVRQLASQMQKLVNDKFNIMLEYEMLTIN